MKKVHVEVRKVRQTTFHKGSDLFGCFEYGTLCDALIDSPEEARNHCKKTGHKVWREYTTVTHYFRE